LKKQISKTYIDQHQQQSNGQNGTANNASKKTSEDSNDGVTLID